MAHRQLYVFGSPRLEHDSQPVELNLRKALALLVYLAVSDQPQSRDALATLLWPESGQRESRARLRRTLHRLTQVLGENVLDSSLDSIRVHPHADLWLDSAAFRQHVAAGLAAAPRDVFAPERLAHLSAAVELYTEDFLAGFTLPDSPTFDEWQFFQRESLRQIYGQVLEQLVQAYRAQQDWDQAIAYARRWLAQDGLHEPAHRLLMRLYAWAGQQAAALRQYQECARILGVELGAVPEDETTALYEAIRTRQFARAAASHPPGSPIPEPQPQQRHALEEPLATNGRVEAYHGSVRMTGQQSQELDSARTALPAAALSDLPAQVPPVSRQKEQQIRFCTSSDGVRISYATVGEGPALVKAANWLSHLEFDWQSPVWRHWLEGLSAQHTLVRYDQRGCGLSDWDIGELSIDAFVRDLETVVDAVGLDRFPLLGVSQGGPIAIAYAVRHPEKVSQLILYGTYAHGRFHRSYAPHELDLAQTALRLMQIGWGQDNPAFRQFFTSLFMPEATPEQMRWFNDLQRVSSSVENAIKIRTAFSNTNVSDLAPKVAAPTLVLHAREDAMVPFEEGRRLAALIPGARLVPLESKNHILLEHEPAWQRFLTEVHRFITPLFSGVH